MVGVEKMSRGEEEQGRRKDLNHLFTKKENDLIIQGSQVVIENRPARTGDNYKLRKSGDRIHKRRDRFCLSFYTH